jgi:Predicted acetamidase/formamidase
MSSNTPTRSPRRAVDAEKHEIKATPETVNWGFFDNSQEPVARVESGDIVRIETVSHHAGDAPDLMMDEGVREIYDEIDQEDRGPGVHVVTGPIHIEGCRTR